MEESKSQPMGIGEIGNQITFPRTFRFTIQPTKKPGIQQFVKRLTVNYLDKLLELSVYELNDMRTHDWIVEMDQPGYQDDFRLTAYDGCGKSIYILDFEGVKIYSHEVEYDYAKSDVVTHKIMLTFEKMNKKESNYDPPNRNVPPTLKQLLSE